MDVKSAIVLNLGGKIENIFIKVDKAYFDSMEEIRIRAYKPLSVEIKNQEFFIAERGEIIRNYEEAFFPSVNDIERTVEVLSGYSRYAFEEELRKGFITIEGGHRIGIAGETVVENGCIRTIKNINGLNIRISHEVLGCADSVFKYICKDKHALHTLIISPPGCGKTTLLRDIVRKLSDESKMNVAVVDERSEIAGCYKGVPQNNVGIRTDVLDCCPKAEGMLMLIRSMSPKVIAVDEIGKNEDIHAIEEIINAGVTVICTVHGKNINDIKNKPVLNKLIEKNIFKVFIVLSGERGKGGIEGVYNEKFEIIYK